MTANQPVEPVDADTFALFARTVQEARPNVMLIGAPAAALRMVGALSLDLRRRIVEGHATDPDSWPRDASTFLQDIEALDLAQQQHLIEWLNDRPHRTHLIAAVGRSLYPEVKRGRFLDTLYYRLNVLQLRLP
jgi:transcriptional regulator of acetoin/glycerol metabolism